METATLSRWRMRAVVALLILLAMVLIGRLIMVQIIEHQRHEAAADRVWQIETRGPRGSILDRNGFPLVTSVDRWEVHVDTQLWGRNGFQPTGTSARLAYLLRADEAQVLSLAASAKGRDALIAYVQYYTGATIHAERLYGVTVRKTSTRRYVEGELAAPVIGIVGRDEQGLAGLEYSLDGDLAGESGLLIYEQDGLGQPIPFGARLELPYEEGADIVLTIDRNLQRIAEQTLLEAVRRWGADGGVIMIADPRNGDILAVATMPAYNPEQLDLASDEFDIGVLRSRAASDIYEPGSVFKVITMAAGLDSKVVTPWTTFIDTGAVVIGDRTIRNFDLSWHGEQTMTQVLQRSLNTGTVWLAQQMGPRIFYEYIEKFGFGQPTDSGLPGESAGLLTTSADVTWSPVQFATTSFGQGVAVTPLQVVQAYMAIANGGELVRPRIVRAAISEGDVRDMEPEFKGRVISAETAATLAHMMQAVVDGVQDHPAQTPGWPVAGKSGTTDVLLDGQYSDQTSLASFAGFAPVDDPRIVVLVRIDRPRGETYGGIVAAPVFSDIVSRSLPYLGVPPSAYVAQPAAWHTGPGENQAGPPPTEASEPDDSEPAGQADQAESAEPAEPADEADQPAAEPGPAEEAAAEADSGEPQSERVAEVEE